MAAQEISDVVEKLYVFVPGAPEALLVAAWRDAARRFFTETLAWRAAPASITVGATNAEYTLAAPYDGSEVFDIANPEMALTPLDKLTFDQAKAKGYPVEGCPAAARIAAPGTMILMPAPTGDVSADLAVTGILRPTRDATQIDDSAAKYYDAIEQGALEYALRVPNQPWSDFKLSNGYRELFQDEIDKFRHRGDGMSDVPRTVRYGGY